MKLIIEIDDDIAKGIRGENECEVEPRAIVRSFQATIADAIENGTPYNPTSDFISREALKEAMWSLVINENDDIPILNVIETIDNAQAAEISQGEWIRGFIDALDKALLMFDANCTYSGERVLQILSS